MTLTKGANLLLLKLTQHTGAWQFALDVVGQDGEPLTGVKGSAAPVDAPPPKATLATASSREVNPFDGVAAKPLFNGTTFEGWEGNLS